MIDRRRFAHHEHGHGGHHHHHHHHDDEPPVFTDPAQESLSQAMRAGFNVLRIIMLVLLIAYFASGWFQVKPGDQGLIVRFGALRENSKTGTPIFEQGWHFALPDPFDTKIPVPGQFYTLRLDTFLFKRVGAAAAKPLGAQPLSEILIEKESLEPGEDGYMITGDRGISHGLWSIEFRIEDAAKYVRNVGSRAPDDLQPILQRLAENAVTTAVAGRRVEEVLRYARPGEIIGDVVSQEVQKHLSDALARLETGVIISKVTSETIEPGRVRPAFYRVNRAQNEQRRLIDEARKQRNQLLSEAAGDKVRYEALLEAINTYGVAQLDGAAEARLKELLADIDARLMSTSGEAQSMLDRARTERDNERESVQREYEQFVNFLDAYRKYPEATRVREWVRMRADILGSVHNEIFFLPAAKMIEILTNRDPQRLLEAEAARFKAPRQ